MDKNSVAQIVSPETQRVRPARHGLMHVLMLFATACWAANIVAVKQALRGFAPLALVQLRVLGAALLYVVLFCAWPRRPALTRDQLRPGTLVVLALSGVAFNQLFFVGGVARTSVAHTGLLVALGPVMVLVLACLLRLEALTILKFVGMLVSFAGVAVLTMRQAGQGTGDYWMGDLIVLAGSAVFAIYTIQLKKVARLYDAISLNTLTYGIGVCFLLPFGARPALESHWSALTAPMGLAVAYIIVFGSVIPYTIYAFAISELTASRIAAFSYLQPVIATGLGIWLLSEKLTLRVIVGGTLILLGVYLTEREKGEERS